MTRAEILEHVVRYEKAWETRDAQVVARTYTRDAVFDSPAFGLSQGPAEIATRLASWFEAFPNLTMNWEEPLLDGDRVVLPFRALGTMARSVLRCQGDRQARRHLRRGASDGSGGRGQPDTIRLRLLE